MKHVKALAVTFSAGKLLFFLGAIVGAAGLSACNKSGDSPAAAPAAVAPVRPAYAATTPCFDMNSMSRAKVGENCISTKGVVFARVVRGPQGLPGWLDTKHGIVWYDSVFDTHQRVVTWSRAKGFCQRDGLKLPSAIDFEKSRAAGLREVFQRRYRNSGVWSEHRRSSEWDGWQDDDSFWTDSVEERRESRRTVSRGQVFAYVYVVSSSRVDGTMPVYSRGSEWREYDDDPMYGPAGELTFGNVHAVCVSYE